MFTPASADQPPAPPPYIHVIAANVGTNVPLPNNGVIKVAFDRYINPLTLNRQSIALRDLFGNAPDSPIVQYDPVTRTATISNPGPSPDWLIVGQAYELSFPVAAEAGAFGLLAIDGATMDPATPKIAFTVAKVDPNLVTKLPVIDFCKDIRPLFMATRTDAPNVQGLCSQAACHGATSKDNYSAMGLVFSSPEGIRHTAINVEAEETTTAALSVSISAQNTFPVGMPIIEPGDPGHSYLIYKLLLPDLNGAPDGTGAGFSYTMSCGPVTPPFDYGPNPHLASADEAARLAALVPGRRMPWGDPDKNGIFGLGGGTPLTLDELERLSVWILQGAPVVDDCTGPPLLCTATH
jgi:hypothetical protein